MGLMMVALLLLEQLVLSGSYWSAGVPRGGTSAQVEVAASVSPGLGHRHEGPPSGRRQQGAPWAAPLRATDLDLADLLGHFPKGLSCLKRKLSSSHIPLHQPGLSTCCLL